MDVSQSKGARRQALGGLSGRGLEDACRRTLHSAKADVGKTGSGDVNWASDGSADGSPRAAVTVSPLSFFFSSCFPTFLRRPLPATGICAKVIARYRTTKVVVDGVWGSPGGNSRVRLAQWGFAGANDLTAARCPMRSVYGLRLETKERRKAKEAAKRAERKKQVGRGGGDVEPLKNKEEERFGLRQESWAGAGTSGEKRMMSPVPGSAAHPQKGRPAMRCSAARLAELAVLARRQRGCARCLTNLTPTVPLSLAICFVGAVEGGEAESPQIRAGRSQRSRQRILAAATCSMARIQARA